MGKRTPLHSFLKFLNFYMYLCTCFPVKSLGGCLSLREEGEGSDRFQFSSRSFWRSVRALLGRDIQRLDIQRLDMQRHQPAAAEVNIAVSRLPVLRICCQIPSRFQGDSPCLMAQFESWFSRLLLWRFFDRPRAVRDATINEHLMARRWGALGLHRK